MIVLTEGVERGNNISLLRKGILIEASICEAAHPLRQHYLSMNDKHKDNP